MARLHAEYQAVADMLTLTVTDTAWASPLPSVGSVQVWLSETDGAFAGVRILDFSEVWPAIDKDQLALLTSQVVVDELDAHYLELPEAPPCFGLEGEALNEALAVGFTLDLEVA